jgi:hypothetical protein
LQKIPVSLSDQLLHQFIIPGEEFPTPFVWRLESQSDEGTGRGFGGDKIPTLMKGYEALVVGFSHAFIAFAADKGLHFGIYNAWANGKGRYGRFLLG